MNDSIAFRLAVLGCLFTGLAAGVSSASAQLSTGAGSAREYSGMWDGEGHDNAYRNVNLGADGSWANGGNRAGTWFLNKNQLVVHFTAHPDWEDTFDLPAHNGVLSGRDTSGATVTLTRHAASAPDKPGATDTADGYFGTRAPGRAGAVATPSDVRRSGLDTSGVVIPPPAPPVATSTPAVRVAPHPVAPPTPAATVASTPPMADPAVVLTPVGKWHWHAGPDRAFKENGSVMDGMKVIGQWKWTNKDKGELQVSWSGTQARAEAYVLSPHGHHLSRTDADGHVLTNDRLDN